MSIDVRPLTPGRWPELRVAGPSDLARLLPFVRDYHAFEGITMTDEVRREALAPLLKPESDNGRTYLILSDDICVGYVAICFGYSIELGGRDAFVDELFVAPAARGQGTGTEVLRQVKTAAHGLGVAALHLEVARTNERARRLYQSAGFTARERFHLMTWIAPKA